MNKYNISIQFVCSTAQFKTEEQKAVTDGIMHYNSRSLLAKNPKRITTFSFSNDLNTLSLELESVAELSMPTKALRLLSSYLVSETCLNRYLSNKQLFKMTASSTTGVKDGNPTDTISDSSIEIERFRILSTDEKLNTIYELLLKREA